VDDVEGAAGQAGGGRVGLDEFDPGDPPLGERHLGHVHVPPLAIEADDRSRRPDPVAQDVEHAERTATDVDRPPAGCNADPVEELRGLRAVDVALEQEPGTLSLADTQPVLH
jgi:hypothetical protein